MYFFVDVETSGFDFWRHSIIQVGCIFTDKYLNIIKEYKSEIKPNKGEWWSDDAYKIHGLSQGELKHAPSLEHVLNDIYNTLDTLIPLHGLPKFVDHSRGKFDWKWLFVSSCKASLEFRHRRYFHVDRYESTEFLARNSHLGFDSAKLDYLCNFYNIKLRHHDALSDVYGCYEIYKKLKHIQPMVVHVTGACLDWSYEKRLKHVHGKNYVYNAEDSDKDRKIKKSVIDNTRMGYIGEWAFIQAYPTAKHVNKEYDFDFRGSKVDIKTSRRKTIVRVPVKDSHRYCDYYFFMHLNSKRGIVEFLGFASKKDVMSWEITENKYGKYYECKSSNIKKVTTSL